MKRFISLGISILLIAFVFCGCVNSQNAFRTDYKNQIESDLSLYPLYQRLNDEEKELYIDICTTIDEHNESAIQIGVYDTEDAADEAVKRAQAILYELVYEHPQYFWVDPYTCAANRYKILGKYVTTINLKYIIDKDEAAEKKVIFDKKVDEILNAANENDLLFDKLLYIYDTILSNVEYDWSVIENENTALLERTAYGCLVGGKTVCSGYSMAFNLFLQKLGIESGVEFNNYDIFLDFDSHVWNYCKLEGEYYYFDLTWDDTFFDSDEYKPYIDHSHIYFGITRDELSKSNSTLVSDAPVPLCNGTVYNYFKQKNQNVSQYSFEAVKEAILNQSENKYIALRFDSNSELLKAEDELMLQGYAYLIFQAEEDIRYVVSDSGLHMYIFFD